MISGIVIVILYLVVCYVLFRALYDHYVDKKPFIKSLFARFHSTFFDSCLGMILFALLVVAILFFVYTLLFDSSIF